MKFDTRGIIRNRQSSVLSLFHRIDIVLVLSILLGLLLRLYSLTSKGIWFDEANSIHFTFLNWSEILHHRYSMRPVYFLILKLLTPIIGTKAYALKFISVLLDTCSIGLIYLVAKGLFNKKTARISAFLYSISCLMIIWAQQIRNYSLGILLTILSFYLFITFIKNNKGLIQVCIINILLTLTLGSGIFILISQNFIFFLYKTSKSIKKRWIASNIISVFILTLFLVYSYNFGNLRENWMAWVPKPAFASILKTIADFSFGGMQQTFGGSGVIIDYRKLIFPFLLIPIFLLFFLKALISKNTNSHFIGYKYLLLIWFFFPLIGLYLFSYIVSSMFFTRFTLISFPPFILLVSKGVDEIAKKKFGIVVYSLIALLMMKSLSVYYSIGQKESLKDLMGIVESKVKQEDLIVIVPTEMILPFMYYYLGQTYRVNDGNVRVTSQGFFLNGDLTKNININGTEILIVDAVNPSNLVEDSTIKIKIESWFNYDKRMLNFFDTVSIKEKIFNHSKIWMVVSAIWVTENTIEKFNTRMLENYRLIDKKNFCINNVFLFEYNKKQNPEKRFK